jgi:hypothetical protein
MIKLLFGTVVAAVAMFITAFLYFAGPLESLGSVQAGERESAVLQEALKANLGATGTGSYVIPNPGTQTGTILYGNGPVATVNFNSNGFPLDSADGMIWGFALYLFASALIAGGLSQMDRRVTDFKSRAVVVVLFAVASSAMAILTDPIFRHFDWTSAIFNFVGSVLVFCVGGLMLARWFMPQRAELEPVAAPRPADTPSVEQVKEAASSVEIPPAGSAGI